MIITLMKNLFQKLLVSRRKYGHKLQILRELTFFTENFALEACLIINLCNVE